MSGYAGCSDGRLWVQDEADKAVPRALIGLLNVWLEPFLSTFVGAANVCIWFPVIGSDGGALSHAARVHRVQSSKMPVGFPSMVSTFLRRQ